MVIDLWEAGVRMRPHVEKIRLAFQRRGYQSVRLSFGQDTHKRDGLTYVVYNEPGGEAILWVVATRKNIRFNHRARPNAYGIDCSIQNGVQTLREWGFFRGLPT